MYMFCTEPLHNLEHSTHTILVLCGLQLMVSSRLVNSHFVNSLFVGIDQMGINRVKIDQAGINSEIEEQGINQVGADLAKHVYTVNVHVQCVGYLIYS